MPDTLLHQRLLDNGFVYEEPDDDGCLYLIPRAWVYKLKSCGLVLGFNEYFVLVDYTTRIYKITRQEFESADLANIVGWLAEESYKNRLLSEAT